MCDTSENTNSNPQDVGTDDSIGLKAPETSSAGASDFAASRYRIDDQDGLSVIVSMSSPNVRLRIAPGMSVNRSGLKRYGRQTIFLDGAFSGPPFHDNVNRQYSLDHHEGCIRHITLSTCEQAAVVLKTGLPINEGTWTLVVNEPDLDALLAAWVLMNHIDLLRDDGKLLADAMPLLKLEGNIDVYGFEKEILTGLSAETLIEEKARIEMLMQPIRALKQAGGWKPYIYEQSALQMLDAIDQLVLPSALIENLLEYKELARIRLRSHRIAIVCQSKRDIYDVESHLRNRYGKLLGLIVLDQGEGRYTLRVSDTYAALPLKALYKALNRIDGNAVSKSGNDNVWGGSNEIGGSPRATGTALSDKEIASEIARIFGRRQSWWRRLIARFAGFQ